MTPFLVQKQDKSTHCYHIELVSIEDPELAEYNRALAALAEKDRRRAR